MKLDQCDVIGGGSCCCCIMPPTPVTLSNVLCQFGGHQRLVKTKICSITDIFMDSVTVS